MELKEITLDYILDYCKAKQDTDWLKTLIQKEGLVNKKGQPRKVSFFEVRSAFIMRYEDFKDLRPTKKKADMYDRINSL